MGNILDEDWIPFAKGIRSLPGRPHISTGYRILSKGTRGVFLETILVGGRRYTSRQALRRFVEAVTAAAARPTDLSAKKTAYVPPVEDQLERDLDDAGI